MYITKSGSRVTISALIFFGVGSLAVFLLEIAERQDLITPLTESTVKLFVCSVLLGILIISARTLPPRTKIGVYVCAAMVVVDFSLDVVENIEYLNNFPLVGHDGHWRHTVERAIVAGWTSGILYLLYAIVRKLAGSNHELQAREGELSRLNEKLQCTSIKLKETQEQVVLQERLAALGQMASGVAHDLNNALTPVLAFADLVQSDDIPEQNRELFSTMKVSVRHAGQVVKELQRFYRGRSHELENEEVVSLPDVIHQAIQLTRFRWYDEALKRGVRFKVLPSLQEGCQVLGNPTELVQLVTNLLVNAIDSMPDGGHIVVSVANVNRSIKLSVSDEGLGMSSEQRAKCFEPFFTTKSSGSGLGLSVSHAIVIRHGGRIEAQPNVRTGTRFVIHLPRFVGGDNRTGEIGIDPISDKRRVLYIDDDEAVRKSMSAILESYGIAVNIAEDGPSGLQMAREAVYDLVIADFAMPGMTGREVVAALKESLPEMPVVLVSGWSGAVVAERFRDDDPKPDVILEKPINVETIKDCLSRLGLLDKRDGGDASEESNV